MAAATLIESWEDASEMACLIVLQAVVGDVQLLLLLPLTPFTYQFVLAQASELNSDADISDSISRALHFILAPRAYS